MEDRTEVVLKQAPGLFAAAITEVLREARQALEDDKRLALALTEPDAIRGVVWRTRAELQREALERIVDLLSGKGTIG